MHKIGSQVFILLAKIKIYQCCYRSINIAFLTAVTFLAPTAVWLSERRHEIKQCEKAKPTDRLVFGETPQICTLILQSPNRLDVLAVSSY